MCRAFNNVEIFTLPFNQKLSQAFKTPTSGKQRGKLSILPMKKKSGINKSFMEEFTSDENGEFEKYTHMIGIPLEENRDLLLELESVQRAVLYNCPLLIHSCIVPVVTRMPLIYVDTVMSTGGASGNRDDVSVILQQIVLEVVNKYVRVKDSSPSKEEYESEGMGGINKDGIKPVMMNFTGLELDGEDCEVLHVIGSIDCDGTKLVRKVLLEIQARIERQGWKTMLPPDNPQEKKQVNIHEGWRPRVPFMRLPSDFKENLPPLPNGEEEWTRSPEDGGNGISPIFWYRWWDDEFTEGDGIRLREIAIYSRSGPWGLSEKAFYLPSMKVKLPDGNEALLMSEAKDKEYAEARLKDQLGEEGAAMEIELDKQIADAKEQHASELEANISENYDVSLQNAKETRWNEENIQNGASTIYSAPDSFQPRKAGDPIVRTISTPSYAQEIIENNGENAAVPEKKNLENIDLDRDEGIIRIRQMLSQKPKLAVDSKQKKKATPLPAYPSDEYFLGVWRLVSSPNMEQLESILPDSSDNIILRVDGGVAGGPVLNQRDNQKAAGGNWRMFQARWAGGGDMPEMEQTRLRIRLIIPPEKNEVLVMEGEVTRVMMPRASSSFSLNIALEDQEKMNNEENDFFLHCNGEVWVQDIEGTGKRRKLGLFSAMKLETPEQGTIRYTVPPPKSLGEP